MSFSFSLSYLIRSQENHWALDAKLNGEQNRHANLYDTALKVLTNKYNYLLSAQFAQCTIIAKQNTNEYTNFKRSYFQNAKKEYWH